MNERIAPECGCRTAGKVVRGMCAMHYDRWVQKTPKSERGMAPRFARSFWDFVDKSGECWVWTGPTNRGGYGFWSGIAVDGRRGLAHRLSLAEVIPCPDETLFACHHCDNRPCVNPDHLYWGTVRQNTDDMLARSGVHNAGHRSTVCPQGHPIEGENLRLRGPNKLHVCRECDNERSRRRQEEQRATVPAKTRVPPSGESHGMARLSWESVRAIRARKADGESVAGLSREYGISTAHAWRIVANQAWREDAHGLA